MKRCVDIGVNTEPEAVKQESEAVDAGAMKMQRGQAVNHGGWAVNAEFVVTDGRIVNIELLSTGL